PAATQPAPAATGRLATASTPSWAKPSIPPTMSSTASTAPTSWRCTCSGATPCARPSASPISRNARTARCFTQSDRGARSTSRTSSPTCRPCGCSGTANSTWVHATLDRLTSRTVTRTSGRSRRRGSSSSHAAGAPADRSAPRVMSPEMPAAGSRMAMRMRSKRRNINGLAAVQPPGARVEEHHALLRFDRAARLELQCAGERCPALWRGVDSLEGLELGGRGGELRVRYGDRLPAALSEHREHEAVPQRARHPQPRRDRLRIRPRRTAWGAGAERLHDRRAAGGLHAVHPRKRPGHPPRPHQLAERLPHADQPGASTRGVHDCLRQGPAELLRQLEGEGLLAFDSVRLAQSGHVHRAAL